MAGVPGDDGGEDGQCQSGGGVGVGAAQPNPVRGVQDQEQERARDREHGGVFGEHGQARAHSGAAPVCPGGAFSCVDGAGQAQSRPGQRAIQGAVGQNPASAGDAEDRGEVQRGGSPVPGFGTGEVLADAGDEPGGEGEKQNEGQAGGQRGLCAEQTCGSPGEPPGGGRVIEIAESQGPASGNHVGFIDTQADGKAKGEADRGGGEDQKEEGAHADSLGSDCSPFPGGEAGCITRVARGQNHVLRLFLLPRCV